MTDTTRPVSKRDEPCTSCGDPLFVCPATIRRFLRCCNDCTHFTELDRSWQPISQTAVTQPATPTTNSDPVLLEAS